jgi:periplasmic protein TonB
LKEQVEHVKPDVLSILHPIHITTPPPKPTPPPRHQSTSRPQVAKPRAVHPPVTQATSGPAEPPYVPPRIAASDGIPGPTGVAPTSGAMTGAATTGPLCSNPNQEAAVINAMSPIYPDSASDFGLGTVTVLVQVTIDAQGRLVDAKIYQSSNNAAIDQAALRAARQTTYAPRIADCTPVEGTYLFHADFSPN